MAYNISEFKNILEWIYQDPKAIKKIDFKQIEAVADAFHKNNLSSKDGERLKNSVVTWLKNPDLQEMIQSKITDVVFKYGDQATAVNDLILCSSSPYFERMIHGTLASNSDSIATIINEETKKEATLVQIKKADTFEQIKIIQEFMRKPKFSRKKIQKTLDIFRFCEFNPRMFLDELDNKSLFNLAEYCSKNISKMEAEEDPSHSYEIYSRVLNRILNKAIHNKLNIIFSWKFSKLSPGECYQVNLKDLSQVSKKDLEKFLSQYVCPAGSDVRQLSLHSLSSEIEELDLSKCYFEHLNLLSISGALGLKVILPINRNGSMEVFINKVKIPIG